MLGVILKSPEVCWQIGSCWNASLYYPAICNSCNAIQQRVWLHSGIKIGHKAPHTPQNYIIEELYARPGKLTAAREVLD